MAESKREFAARVHCVRHHADAERLIAWIRDPKRKPVKAAFTAGPDRQVAYEIEMELDREWRRCEEGNGLV